MSDGRFYSYDCGECVKWLKLYLIEQGFKQFRKKPIVIWAKEMEKQFSVKTLEGTMEGQAGDFLIIGIKGEAYPCDRDIFFGSYDKVEGK